MGKIQLSEYKAFMTEIKEKIYRAQYQAMKSVNKELIRLYWDIGKAIVEKQEELGWGKSVVENLAWDLQQEFTGIKGFSTDNLWRMRKFYLACNCNEKLAPLVQEISWSHFATASGNLNSLHNCLIIQNEFISPIVYGYFASHPILKNNTSPALI